MVRLEFSLRGVLTIFGIVIGLILLVKLLDVFLLIGTALMLAAAVVPFIEWMMRRGISRTAAAVIFAVLILALFALFGIAVVPPLIAQGRTLAEKIPDLRDHIVTILQDRHQSALAARVQQFSVGDVLQPSQLASTGQALIGIVTEFVTVIFLMIYIVVDARRIERFVYFAVPAPYDYHLRQLMPALHKTVGGYIRGQLITSLMISIFTAVLCVALGVPNGLALGVLAGVTDFIPVVGLLLAVLPATLAALTISVTTAIVVGAALFAYQEFENHVLVPRIYGQTLRLPTIAVFVALLIGAKLAGFIGAILSLPIAAALRVILEYVYDVRTGHPLDLSAEDEPFAPDTPEQVPEPAGGVSD